MDAISTRSLTRQLTELIRSKPIAQNDLDGAAIYLLDAVSNAVAGRATQPGSILLDWAEGRKMDEGRRAFLMGALAHIVEMDDLHRASVTHPGCVVVPAVIAIAADSKHSGEAILQALLQGFEACIRVGMAVGSEHYRIWHNTSTCGPFGSAMAVAALLKLNDDQTVDALGNAGTQASGLWQFLETGAMSKHLHAGRAAESGLLAAQLAARQFSGSPRILEGERGIFAAMSPTARPLSVTEAPEAPWQLRQTSIKPWPCCRHAHPVIDAALELAPQVDIGAVERIEIETYQAAMDRCDCPQPATLYEAKFSLQYCALAALADGKIDLASFDQQRREQLAHLDIPISVTLSASCEERYPEAWGARLTLRLSSGKTAAAQRKECRGDPNMALTPAEVIQKARMLMLSAGMEPESAEQLIADILALAQKSYLPSDIPSKIVEAISAL